MEMLTNIGGGLLLLDQQWQPIQSPEMVGKWLENDWPANVVLLT